MKTTNELYDERLKRIKAAVALENPDRVPVVPLGDAFCAKTVGVKLADFCTKPELARDTMIKAYKLMGEVDGVQHVSFNVYLLSVIWLSKLKVPGIDLEENELWQVSEAELMSNKDYDFIIENGYGAFIEKYYKEKLDDLEPKWSPFTASLPAAINSWKELGIVPFSPAAVTIPYELFCGGRSFTAFLKDLYRMPDKVHAAMEASMPYILESTRQLARGLNPIGLWVGGWRSASEFLSPKLWQRFIFPFYKEIVQTVIDEGVVPILHFDSDWTRDLEYFKEFPRAKCVLSLDGSTDIYKAKEVLGDHMCLMGDVPPSMLTLAKPDDVYAYCQRLIRDIGPNGFILAQGCDIPPDAKLENVQAMISAAIGK